MTPRDPGSPDGARAAGCPIQPAAGRRRLTRPAIFLVLVVADRDRAIETVRATLGGRQDLCFELERLLLDSPYPP